MDDKPESPKESKKAPLTDLSELQSFRFGTEWTTSSPESTDATKPGFPDRSRSRGPGSRDTRPTRPERRDRRPPRREGSGSREAGPAQGQPGGAAQPSYSPGRTSRPQEERAHRSNRPREDRSAQYPQKTDRPFRRGPERPDLRPYQSQVFDYTVYPQDTKFEALTKVMRSSCRTYELFEIAHLILEKPDRMVISVRRRREEGQETDPSLFASVPDGLPFASEEEALQHVFAHYLDRFLTSEEVEVDPPKGNFQVVSKCSRTGELLGPPNYHRYQQILIEHHQTHFPHTTFERFRAGLETLRDPEVIAAWIEKMKKVSRHSLLPELEEAKAFDTLSEAQSYLVKHHRDKLVAVLEFARLPADELLKWSKTEVAKGLMGHLERQRRFPLDTSNALRGRLRRENFHIYKKGSKGVTFVCSVRRKHLSADQLLADSVAKLISFIDANPQVNIRDLPLKVLGLEPVIPGAEGEEALHSEDHKRQIQKLFMDLRWLVTEGYVVEFSDGRLLASKVGAASEAPPKGPHKGRSAATSKNSTPSDSPPEEEMDQSGDSSPESSSDEGSPAAAGDETAAEGEISNPDSAAKASPALETSVDSGGEESLTPTRHDEIVSQVDNQESSLENELPKTSGEPSETTSQGPLPVRGVEETITEPVQSTDLQVSQVETNIEQSPSTPDDSESGSLPAEEEALRKKDSETKEGSADGTHSR